MQQLSGQDGAFLYLETPGAHLNLTGLYVYEQPGIASGDPADDLNYADIIKLITAALEQASELRQRLLRPPLDIDYPMWVEDADFDIADHLHAHPGPAPRSRKALFNAVAAIHAEPLDLAHAPWEMHIIDRLNAIPGFPPRCFAIIMKYHHAAIDGASGAALIDRLHGLQPQTEPSQAQPEAAPGTAEMLVRAAYHNTINALSLVRTLAEAAPGLVRKQFATPHASKPPKQIVPRTRFNGPVSARRVMHAVSIDLERLRAVRTAVPGATINDVLLTLCGGALRSWLQSCEELPADSLVAMVPVNTRTEHESEVPGNRISTLFVPIGTDIENPLARLRMIHQASRRSKSGEDGLEPRQLAAITRHLPALPLSMVARLVTGLGLGYRGPRLCNCTITNVPAQGGALYLGPARLVYAIGNGPLIDGMGLIISVFTYQGQVHLVFTSCPEMLPDPAVLAGHTEQVLKQLEKAVKSSQ
jgi:diacylglycerol O-acyltransferase